jgi:hypothetical protein
MDAKQTKALLFSAKIVPMAAARRIRLRIGPKPRKKEDGGLGQRLSIESDFKNKFDRF